MVEANHVTAMKTKIVLRLLPNGKQEPEECDATMLNNSTEAGFIKKENRVEKVKSTVWGKQFTSKQHVIIAEKIVVQSQYMRMKKIFAARVVKWFMKY